MDELLIDNLRNESAGELEVYHMIFKKVWRAGISLLRLGSGGARDIRIQRRCVSESPIRVI